MRLTVAICVFVVLCGLSAAYGHEELDDIEPQAQTSVGYRSRVYDYSAEEEPVNENAQQQIIYQNNRGRQAQPSGFTGKKDKKLLKAEKEEEEVEEPDRLTVLLAKSNFNCNSKTTGYYADESLGCEVFHYCQENQRHSWICPEGFTFHQIHLICMPPSGENICEESSKYHIVNDYLYKPINVEEHQTKPNVSLRYSERYYPESFYHDERRDYEEERPQAQAHRTPIQVGFNSQQRKAPSQPTTSSPIPYRFGTSQQPQQTVYRSPEEINISLQQRRPQYFIPQTTPKYNEDDYGYEK